MANSESEKMLVRILLGIIAALVLIILFGCVEPEPVYEHDYVQGLIKENTDLNFMMANTNVKIIGLQENAKYVTEQLRKIKEEKKDLQNTYNKIALDWQNCSMANYCLYYPGDCVEYVGINFDVYGYTAEELQVEYSDLCDASNRDWEEYWDAYTGEE